MSKNIEYVQSEVVGSEMVETATDSSKLGDLITEAWATQYARTTGLPVAQPAVQVETEVVELKSLLLALLRAVWKTPTRLFGGSTLGAAVNNGLGWLRSRLLGDTTYGIPAYPNAGVEEAKAVLRRRDMSSGVLFGDTPLPDGMSLVNLLCGYRSQVTELKDDNEWIMSSTFPWSYFPNLTKVQMGCASSAINVRIANGLTNLQELSLTNYDHSVGTSNDWAPINNCPNLKILNAPNLRYVQGGDDAAVIDTCSSIEEINLPSLERVISTRDTSGIAYNCSSLKRINVQKYYGTNNRAGICYQCAAVEEIYAESFGYLNGDATAAIKNLPVLWIAKLGNISVANSAALVGCVRLIHLEFKSVNVSINVSGWSPTMALRTDTDAEGYVDLREDKDEHGEFIYANNLEQFLANFSSNIIDRLAQRTASTTRTLTLSQAVRNVLTAEQEQAIANKYWNLSPANKTT